MNNYDLRVLVDGKYVTKYNSNGDVYLEGRPGSTYEIELVNNTNTDAEFVVSVDGLSILDGKPAGSSSTGYVISAYRTSRIKGWKVDAATAAAFKFGAKGKSYAAVSAAGDVQNAGVIGLQVFPRKYLPPVYPPVITFNHTINDPWYYQGAVGADMPRSFKGVTASLSGSVTTNNTASVSKGGPVMDSFSGSVGTEFGEATQFNTTTVDFQRASNAPRFQYIMYYGDAKDLNKLGIVLDWQQPTSKPQAFPADGCVPPQGWTKE